MKLRHFRDQRYARRRRARSCVINSFVEDCVPYRRECCFQEIIRASSRRLPTAGVAQ
ncbi:MAG: hypothetical protein ND807_07810 [Vicinamibacterales bacterium]|nr:hypothetical protein [Vicinamibacterales bacterium]